MCQTDIAQHQSSSEAVLFIFNWFAPLTAMPANRGQEFIGAGPDSETLLVSDRKFIGFGQELE